MTRIDFYVLPANCSAGSQSALPIDIDNPLLAGDEKQRYELVCKLALKAAHQQQRVYVHTPDSAATGLLDTLLSQQLQHSDITHRLALPVSRQASQRQVSQPDGNDKPMHRPSKAAAITAYNPGARAPVARVREQQPSHSAAGTNPVVIEIGHNSEPTGGQQVLINLAAQVPLFFSRFRRMLEIVSADDEQRLSGRQRYLFYRDRGYPLQHHHLR